MLEWLKFVLLNNNDHSVNTLLLYFHYFGCKYCKMHLLDLLFEINAKIKIQFQGNSKKWLHPVTSQSVRSPYWKTNMVHLSFCFMSSSGGQRMHSESEQLVVS